jgi:cytochrome bd-type quinol oxidase subunit 2
MQTTFWLVLLGVFLAGYLVLEGADFGAGMVLPVLGRADQPGRDAVVRAIAPLFLGNEVWLVVTIGVAEGVFPRLDGMLLTRLYPAFALILVAWLVRDAGLWFRGHGGAGWRWRWDRAIAVASGLLAFGWGVVLGDLAVGVPVGAGSVFGLGPTLCGVLLAGFGVLHGTVLLRRRLPAQQRIRRVAVSLSLPLAGVVVLAAVGLALTWSHGRSEPLWVLGSITLVAVLAVRLGAGAGVRVLTSAVLSAAVPLAALPSFPELPTDSSAAGTLGVLTPLVIAVSPVLIAAQVALWWLSRAKADGPAGGYF